MVLSICKACLDNGCNIVVRAARENAKAKHARMEVDTDREALRAEALAVDEAHEVATTTSEEVQTLPKKKRNIRSTRRKYVKDRESSCTCMLLLMRCIDNMFTCLGW